jgi:hypothetical protein
MATLWSRVWGTGFGWSTGKLVLASASPGQTIARVHFGVRWTGITASEDDFNRLAEDFMAVGVVSQDSGLGSTPPDALTGADDFAPPLQRWLWWGTLNMTPTVIDAQSPGVMVWTSSATVELGDGRTQVKANVAAGHTLDLYLSWRPWVTTAWGTGRVVQGSAWASTLTLL